MIRSRPIVLLYLTTAHISLALACAITAWDPYAVAGFFYHSRMVAIVHLITIGWIAMSILGLLYVVVPMHFGAAFAARRTDYAAYALIVIGLIGMVSHFWLAEFRGMAWSAATAAAGIALVVIRVVWSLRTATVAGGVKVYVSFASLNILGAASMGILLGFDKVYQFLPGYVLSNVFAHAHLAAIGWACMMVIAIGYTWLPMVVAVTPLAGPAVDTGAIVLEVGIAGLFVTLLRQSALAPLFALAIVAGFAAAGAHVIGMLNRPRTALPAQPRCRFALAHVVTAAGWLVLACVFGLLLTIAPMTEMTLRAAMLYGVFGLIGFLAQMIAGLQLCIFGTSNALRRSAIYCAWLAGVPGLAAGLFLNAPYVLATGAWLLFGAVVLGAIDIAIVAFPTRPTTPT